MTPLEFLGGMFGTRAVEIVAALCGLINVVLIVRRSMWNYPFGLVMVTLYGWIFYDYKLYSDALLQVFFFVIQVFGVWWWWQGREPSGRIAVRPVGGRATAGWAMVAAVGTLALGGSMARWTDASLPFWDAATTVLSIIAQTLMARRILESWLVWIAVDVLAIGIYMVKGLTPTAALYAVFLGLAISGWYQLRASYRIQAA